MIEKIFIKNYKCFGPKEIEIELKPLTIFYGPNGSGKSSILEMIGILAQSAHNSQKKIGLNFQDELVFIPSDKDAFHKGDLNQSLKLGFAFPFLEEDLRDLIPVKLSKSRLKFKSLSYLVEYISSTHGVSQEIYVDHTCLARNWMQITRRTKTNFASNTILEFPIFLSKFKFHAERLDIFSEQSFQLRNLEPFAPARVSISDFEKKQAEHLSKFSQAILNASIAELENVFYLSCERPTFGMLYKPSPSPKMMWAGRPLWVGRQGERTIQILSLVLNSNEYRESARKIRDWAKVFGLPELSAGVRGEDSIGADYIDSDFSIPIDYSQAGYGSRQMLTIIVQLFTLKQKSVVMIEEPEISLHPEAQSKLPLLFADALQDQNQIIISTHSNIIPLSISRAVHKKKLRPEDIAVYHLEKTKKGTHTKRLRVNERGYIPGWIPSFAKTEDKLSKEWFDSIENRSPSQKRK